MKIYSTSSLPDTIDFNRIKMTCYKDIALRIKTGFVNLKNKISHLHSTKLTGGSIWVLEKIYGKADQDQRLQMLRALPAGTVGFELAKMLDGKHYRLIPKFEDHDLKHIVLNFEMTRKDEIRMQAYLLGNGNYTLPCVAFLTIALIYPFLWRELIIQYRLGRQRKSIYYLALDDCLHRNLEDVRAEYAHNSWYSDILTNNI